MPRRPARLPSIPTSRRRRNQAEAGRDAAAPAPAPEPKPKPIDDAKKEPDKQVEAKPADAPATEVTPDPQPKQEVKPDPVAQTIVAETPEAETIKLPDVAPAPESRPQPPEAQTAKAPDRKETDKPQEKQANKPKSDEKEFNADEVAALLNKEKAAGGGAKRSTDEASLGGKKRRPAQKLSQSEKDGWEARWSAAGRFRSAPQDTEHLRVSVRFKLDTNGKLEGSPEVETSSGNRQFDESAVRAVQKCDRNGLRVPDGKQEIWAEVVVNFDPSEMF